jgi:hypothetical protein
MSFNKVDLRVNDCVIHKIVLAVNLSDAKVELYFRYVWLYVVFFLNESENSIPQASIGSNPQLGLQTDPVNRLKLILFVANKYMDQTNTKWPKE